MNSAIPSIVAIIAAFSTAGIVNAISFSTPVNAQATVFQGGTCTGPDKACDKGVFTPSGNTNLQGQSHNTGITQQGGATTFRICVDLPTQSCTGGVFTPSGNDNTHQHNTTSTP